MHGAGGRRGHGRVHAGLLVVAAREGTSLGELGGVAVAMLAFYGPAALWAGGWWSIAAILLAGLVIGVLAHRYRVTEIYHAPRLVGRVVFALLLMYAGWVLVVGVAFLAYAV